MTTSNVLKVKFDSTINLLDSRTVIVRKRNSLNENNITSQLSQEKTNSVEIFEEMDSLHMSTLNMSEIQRVHLE